MGFTLVVHGGAGSARDELESPERMATLSAAVEAGAAILRQGGGAVDAVEAAVRVMEDSEHFNAGRGSAYHELGGHEMDAALMCGGEVRFPTQTQSQPSAPLQG